MDSITLATIISCTTAMLQIPEPTKLPIIVEHAEESRYDWEAQVILVKPGQHPSITIIAISEWLFDEAGIYKYPMTYLETVRAENNGYVVAEMFGKQCVDPVWHHYYKKPLSFRSR